jgi:hypothetical protein
VIFPAGESVMDDIESTYRLSPEQGAPRVYQRRDGGCVVAHDEDGVTFVGKLTIVPRKTDLDRFEDALQSARNDLEGAVSDIVHQGLFIDDARDALAIAFGRYDFEVFHAFEALRS